MRFHFDELVENFSTFAHTLFESLPKKQIGQTKAVLVSNNINNLYDVFRGLSTFEGVGLRSDPTKAYLEVDHPGEDNITMKTTKIHRSSRTRNLSFPTLYDEACPHYGANIIYSDKDNTNKIMVMEGPKNAKFAGNMVRTVIDNDIDVIVVSGQPDADDNISEMKSEHFDYYTKDEVIVGEYKIRSTKVQPADKRIKNINIYDLEVRKINAEGDAYKKRVLQIPTRDGDKLDLNIYELAFIYDQVKGKNMAAHCKHGRGRSPIIPMALKFTNENVLESTGDAFDFAEIEKKYKASFLDAAGEKRAGLGQMQDQFDQKLAYAMTFTQFKNQKTPEAFPEAFLDILVTPAAIKQEPAPVAISATTAQEDLSLPIIPKSNDKGDSISPNTSPDNSPKLPSHPALNKARFFPAKTATQSSNAAAQKVFANFKLPKYSTNSSEPSTAPRVGRS